MRIRNIVKFRVAMAEASLWSAPALAAAAGVSYGSLNNALRNGAAVRRETALALAVALDRPLEELFEDGDSAAGQQVAA